MYIYIIAAIIAVVLIGFIIISKPVSKPVPSNGQVVLDRAQNEWLFLRPLNYGAFLFRSPVGKIKSQTLKEMEKNGFLNQFDFKSRGK